MEMLLAKTTAPGTAETLLLYTFINTFRRIYFENIHTYYLFQLNNLSEKQHSHMK